LAVIVPGRIRAAQAQETEIPPARRLPAGTSEVIRQAELRRGNPAAFADDPPVTLERYEFPAGTITG
jgi:hypothetical protein